MDTAAIGNAFNLYVNAIKTTQATTDDDGATAGGLRLFSRWCHEAQVKAGWWTDLETGEKKKRNKGQLIGLMHSEVSEAMEADRKNLADDKLPHRKGLEVELGDMLIRMGDFIGSLRKEVSFADCMLDNIISSDHSDEADFDPFADIHRHLSSAYDTLDDEEECVYNLADAAAAAIRFAVSRDLDLWGAIEEKAAFNVNRPDHKIENRKAEGGKAY